MGEINSDLVITLTQTMVRIHSEPGDEKMMADFLLDELPTMGFDRVWMDELGNVVGEIHGTGLVPMNLNLAQDPDRHCDQGVVPAKSSLPGV